MTERIPIRFYDLSPSGRPFAEFQPGEFVPARFGGTGTSSLPLLASSLTSSLSSLLGISSLNDTTITSPTNSQVLTWSSAFGKWIPATPPGATGGEANTITNLGSGEGLYYTKVGVDLKLKSLSGINLIVSSADVNTIVVSAMAPVTPSGEANTAANVGVGQGVYYSKSGDQLNFRSLSGLNLSVYTDGQTLVVSAPVGLAGGIQSINSQTGSNQSISVTSGLGLLQGTNSITLGANYTSAIWNASAFDGIDISGTPSQGQGYIYDGTRFVTSTISAGGGTTNHSALTNLNANDHPQYVLSATNLNLSSDVSNHIASASVHFTQASIDHGSIAGLADNDHPQYVLSATNLTLSSNVSNHIASASVHFTEASIDHSNILNHGTNTHATIDNHLANTSNPHSTTAAQVGNTTSQWNASAIDSRQVSGTPSIGQVLAFDNTKWIPSSISFPLVITSHSSLTNLSANDHPQYVLSSTNSSLSSLVNNHIASASVHFTEASIDHSNILNHGTYTHLDLDHHIDNLNNPHATTAAQVGNTTAQWNASALVGNQVSGTPTTGQALVYDSAKWVPSTLPTAAPGGGITSLNSQTGVAQTITASGGLILTQGTDTFNLSASYTSAIWNASAIDGVDVSGTPTIGQVYAFDGTRFITSSLSLTGGSGISQAQALNLSMWGVL